MGTAGRAVVFPQNTGVPAGTQLEVWRLKPATGERKGSHPVEAPDLTANGSWGPLKLLRGKRYEFALTRLDGVVHQPDDLVDGIETLLDDTKLRERLVDAARAHCHDHSWERTAQRHLALWESLEAA